MITETPPAVKTEGLIAPVIQAYLENPEKSFSERVLSEARTAFERMVTRQLMETRPDRAGIEHNTLYSHPCSRKAYLTYHGAPREPLQARALVKFLMGDTGEILIGVMAALAGLDIGFNNEELCITGKDGVKVPVHPDFLLHALPEYFNIEGKTCDTYTFDQWLAQGGPDDTWGYRTQASVEIAAWREAGWQVNDTLFIAISTGSRQGSIAEWRIPYEPDLVEAWHDRRAQARGAGKPALPFALEPESQFVKGKEAPAGAATPRTDKNGKVYGWDIPTGRKVLPLLCSYCAYKQTVCYPTAVLELDGAKPVWVMP